jgi:hypothetical protein
MDEFFAGRAGEASWEHPVTQLELCLLDPREVLLLHISLDDLVLSTRVAMDRRAHSDNGDDGSHPTRGGSCDRYDIAPRWR